MTDERGPMDLKNVDLNLFLIFDTIYTEKNLTRAGEVLCITQPAVSNALSRLRETFNDPLFVRSPQGMIPTPVAQNIIGKIRSALQLMRASVQEQDSFDSVTSKKKFRLSMGDLAEAMVLPGILEVLQQKAPHINMVSVPIKRKEIVKELASGKLDFAIEVPVISDSQLQHVKILEDRYVCVVRKDHPQVKGELCMEQFLALSHIHLSRRERGEGHIDQALVKLGVRRRIALRAQHYLMAPHIISRTDLALTMPHFFARQYDLQILPLPFEVPALELHLYWHEKVEQDQTNLWMRQLIQERGGLG